MARRCPMRKHIGLLLLCVGALVLAPALGCRSRRAPVARGTSGTARNTARGMALAWTYDGGPPLEELTGLYVLPDDLLIGAWEYNAAHLYALSASRGKLFWERNLQDRLLGQRPAFIGKDGLLYSVGFPSLRAQSRALLGLDPRTGRLVRELPLPGNTDVYVRWGHEGDWALLLSVAFPPVLTVVNVPEWRVAWTWRPSGAEDTIVDVWAGSRDVAVLVQTGGSYETRILQEDAGRIVTVKTVGRQPPRLARSGSVVYLPEEAGRVVRAVSLDSGQTRWQYDLQAGRRAIALQPFAHRAHAWLLLYAAAEAPEEDSLVLLDGATGRRLWGVHADTLGLPHPHGKRVVPEWRAFGNALVGLSHSSQPGAVIALSAETGHVLWRRAVTSLSPEADTAASCRFVPGEYGNAVVLQVQSGRHLVFATLDPETGEATGRAVDPEGVTYTETSASDGRMLYYVGGESIIALHLPDSTAAVAR